MSGEVRVKGLAELQKYLNELPARMEANVLRSALREGAKVIAEEVKSRVPKNTGKLRDSIRISTRSRRGTVYAVVSAGKKGRKHVTQGKNGRFNVAYDHPYYAPWVEFGTKPHKIGAKFAKALVLRSNKRASSGTAKRWMRGEAIIKGVDHPGAKPRPFMRPALDGKAQEALIAVGNAIRRRLSTKHGLTQAGDVEIG